MANSSKPLDMLMAAAAAEIRSRHLPDFLQLGLEWSRVDMKNRLIYL